MKTLIVLFFALIATCHPGANPPLQQAGTSTEPAPAPEDMTARAVLDEVNALRAAGCKCPGGRRFAPAPALRWDEQLERAAQDHADDMERRNYFSHTSPGGAQFSSRISNAGYKWKVVGENIAKGYPTAQAVVNGWRASEGHCLNLMNPKFRDMGVGKTGPYWVQDFGSRK